MGVSKIFQIYKNMELRENQEWINRNKTTRKKAEWYRGTATGVISDISDFERQPRIKKVSGTIHAAHSIRKERG